LSFGSPYVTLPDFTYHKPSTVEEALGLLTEYGDDAEVMGGGVGLIAFMKERLISPTHVIDVKDLAELKNVELVPGKGLSIGSAVTLAELLEGKDLAGGYEVLREAISRIADPMVRSRATLVGNMCEAIPWVDSPPALIALDSSVEIAGPAGKRTVPVSGFIRGPVDVDLNTGEIVTAISIPSVKGRVGAFEKYTGGSEFSLASVAVALWGEGKGRAVRVVYGAVNSTPVRSAEVEEILAQGLTLANAKKAAETASQTVECLDDVLAGATYRKHLLKVITTKVLRRMIVR